MRRICTCASLLLSVCAVAMADEAQTVPLPAPGQSDQVLVIYKNSSMKDSGGFASVTDTRLVDLKAGMNQVKWIDIPTEMNFATTFFKSLTAPDSTRVLEQSYEFDAPSPDKLLARYIGRPIIINRRQPPLPDEKTRSVESLQGTLLAFDQNMYVIQTENRQLPAQMVPRGNDISEIKLFDLPNGLVARPTLEWKIRAEKPGLHKMQVTYETSKIDWKVDYRIELSKEMTAADISGWVMLTNSSGASFVDARIKLIEGASDQAAAARRYVLTSPVSISNGASKQVEVLKHREKLPAQKQFVYDALGPVYRGADGPDRIPNPFSPKDGKRIVDTYLEITTRTSQGTTPPLPGGCGKIFIATEMGNEVLGEFNIGPTEADQPLRIPMGPAPDLSAERTQSEIIVHDDDRTIVETIVITLHNTDKNAVAIVVREPLFRWSTWEINSSSDRFEKVDAHNIRFPIEIPAGEIKTVRYTVRYSW